MTAPAIIMVAPNGARRDKRDHPALPLHIAETAAEAARCQAAGFSVLHAHVRDEKDEHTLDSGLYRELIAEVGRCAPGMWVQITTEALGRYSVSEQVACVQALQPPMASVALREMRREGDKAASAFYHWAAEAGVHIQHILYSVQDVQQFNAAVACGVIPAGNLCVLFVLGAYSARREAVPGEIEPMLAALHTPAHWFVCAFGARENACIELALSRGGHARVGFENNLFKRDAALAENNAALVREAVAAAKAQQRIAASASDVQALLLGRGCVDNKKPH